MKFKQVVAGATAGVLLSGVAFSLMGAGSKFTADSTVTNNYNHSKVFTSQAYNKDDQAVSVTRQLNEFMADHPNGKVQASISSSWYIIQYTYHK